MQRQHHLLQGEVDQLYRPGKSLYVDLAAYLRFSTHFLLGTLRNLCRIVTLRKSQGAAKKDSSRQRQELRAAYGYRSAVQEFDRAARQCPELGNPKPLQLKRELSAPRR